MAKMKRQFYELCEDFKLINTQDHFRVNCLIDAVTSPVTHRFTAMNTLTEKRSSQYFSQVLSSASESDT